MDGLAVITRAVAFEIRISATQEGYITADGLVREYRAEITLDRRVKASILFSTLAVGGAVFDPSGEDYDDLDIQLLARFKRLTRLSKRLKNLAESLQTSGKKSEFYSGRFKPNLGNTSIYT